MKTMTNPRVRSGLTIASVLVSLLSVARAQQWSLLTPPVPRFLTSAVYDPNSSQMIIFGGVHAGGTHMNDVWRLQAPPTIGVFRWIQSNASGSGPQPRQGHTAVYDPTPGIDRMTIFGGGLGNSSPCANDAWVLTNASSAGGTLASWTLLATVGDPPSPRINHTAVFDPGSNRMIVFGGQNCFTTFFSDVWVLVNANGLGGTPTWQQLNPTGSSPGPRGYHTAVYDPLTNRMIIHGGGGGVSLASDVWILSNANGLGGIPAWSQLNVSGGPGPICCDGAVFDPHTNNMIIFGGQSDTALLGGTWILSNANGQSGTPAWNQVTTTGFGPTPRSELSAAFNPVSKQMLVFGGLIALDGTLDDNNVFRLLEPPSSLPGSFHSSAVDDNPDAGRVAAARPR